MKFSFLLRVLIFSFFYTLLSTTHCQKSSVAKFIVQDYEIVNKTFNNNLYRFICDTGCPSFFTVIEIDSFNIPLTKTNMMSTKSIMLLRTRIKHTNTMFSWPIDVFLKLSNDTLDYYTLSTINGVYKLFGFYTSDMNYLISHIKIDGLIDITHVLANEKILTKSESKCLIKAIRKGLKEYPTALHKPANLLKYYFSESNQNKANTILLPLEPLIPPDYTR